MHSLRNGRGTKLRESWFTFTIYALTHSHWVAAVKYHTIKLFSLSLSFYLLLQRVCIWMLRLYRYDSCLDEMPFFLCPYLLFTATLQNPFPNNILVKLSLPQPFNHTSFLAPWNSIALCNCYKAFFKSHPFFIERLSLLDLFLHKVRNLSFQFSYSVQ